MTNTVTFHCGDVRDVLAAMPDNSVDFLVTSPPFLALRSYLPADHPDKHREIGSETTPAAFIDTMLALTADWRRVVADWGSIAVEIGDTYSGSATDGVRLVGSREHRPEREGTTADGGGRVVPSNGGPGWPLAKSLCGIPTLYTWSLAYGRNLLTGNPSPAGQWRVRNLLTWTRPNPPVGALGDKFRPATSFVTVACCDTQKQPRWFDLDAVRTENPRVAEDPGGYRMVAGVPTHDAGPRGQNPAGAPPLDWWDDDWQPLHRLPTQPYKGSHYAAFPVALPQRLIEAMCPREVCAVCGEGRRRIVESETTKANGAPIAKSNYRGSSATMRTMVGREDWLSDEPTPSFRTTHTTLGWSDCGHGNYRPGIVLDPFGGSGTTALAAALCGRDAVLIDIDRRNIDLARHRIAEAVQILDEHVDGDTTTWTVDAALPGLKHEHPDQQSLFGASA